MKSRRLLKAASAVREVVSTTILFHIRDPRVQNVTVLAADVAPDMRTAKVYVSVLGTPKQQSLCLHGLESAKGFIQSKIADRMQTRYTPVLKFVLDQGVKKSLDTSELLREVLPPEGFAPDPEADAGEADSVSSEEAVGGGEFDDDWEEDLEDEEFDDEEDDDDWSEEEAGLEDDMNESLPEERRQDDTSS